jgi:branched-chain amino acid transport system substrate-binding protein
MNKKSIFLIAGFSVAAIVMILFLVFLRDTKTQKVETGQIAEKILPKEKITGDGKIEDLKIDHNKEIVFGQSAFLSGSFQLYGELIRNSIRARFYRENEAGGINGKKLRLVSFDDKGEPSLAQKNIDVLRKQHKVDMFLGNMGTRSVFKVLSLIEAGEIAMFFPWGGAKKLRTPKYKFLVNGLGHIYPQIKELVRHIIEDRRYLKIAIFHDDGSFGKENVATVIKELDEYEVKPVTASYNRFTMDIATPAEKIIKADPKVILCLSTTMPTVKLINKVFEKGHYGTLFFGIDSTMFVGDILKARGVKFNYSSSVPNPKKSKKEIVKQYREDMKKHFPEDPVNILSLSYYIHASIIIEAMKGIEGAITKEKIIEKIEAMEDLDIGGFPVTFDPETRHAYKHVISIIKG